jgi:hypothetical protein
MLIKYRLLAIVILFALLNSACAGPAQPAPQKQVEAQFISHLAGGMPEQDVFVVKPSEPEGIYRIDASIAADYTAVPVYAAADTVDHDLFALRENPFGPYPKGNELGFTMEAWLAGTGHGVYTVAGDQAVMDFTFEKLVPNGVYTMWCSTVYMPPEDKVIDEPCGAADGSQNTFVADAEGKAEFHLTLEPLPDTTDKIITSIAVAYHSDGKTYGSSPGDFGLNSHVQLFFAVPAPDSEAWQVVTDHSDVAHVHE